MAARARGLIKDKSSRSGKVLSEAEEFGFHQEDCET